MKAPAVKPKAAPAKAIAAVKSASTVKAAASAPIKKSDVSPKSVSKIAASPVTKSVVKPPEKTVAKAPVIKKVASAREAEPARAMPASQPVAPRTKKKSDPVPTIDPIETVMSSVKTAKASQSVEAVTDSKTSSVAPPMTSLGVPVRSGRPSSRLAQLTVPSMAQSVASTAAKASFTQMTTVQPIVSPLASAIKKDPKLANNWKKKSVAELTDAEVLAMSDDDYMNDTQMAFFRLKLVSLKNDILSNAGETTEHLREDTVVVPDPADRATIEEEHALELRTRDRERKLLKKIEQSINRIDAGDYGYCDETGEPIGVGRLLARPTANLSLEAQQRRELKQKMFGD
ncbi:RNA polymerase-binding protein DksA [Rhodoferax sp.]|uniref:RNA polymerase-binding protein DksA n=1 Tax=Rhodoferax sp. TaxID=50421 RepID=UPI00284796AF|nr:RNA polymerase-binding protein DksA [Rhodoferax sp.]MDR3371483.1 RNA polymerase-binding protein DksA [Rhodoferax sp.]